MPVFLGGLRLFGPPDAGAGDDGLRRELSGESGEEIGGCAESGSKLQRSATH